MDDLVGILRGTPLFASASEVGLMRMIATIDTRILTLAAGDTLTGAEHVLGVLLQGSAQVLSNDEGRTVLLRMLLPGDVFGAAALFCPEELPLSRIEAASACKVLLFTRETMLTLLHEEPAVLETYLTFLAGRVWYLNRKICCFTAGTAPRRLALWLLSEERETVTLPVSLSALSDMLDIGRASLYRALDQLTHDGLIQKNGRHIQILDRKRLLEYYH